MIEFVAATRAAALGAHCRFAALNQRVARERGALSAIQSGLDTSAPATRQRRSLRVRVCLRHLDTCHAPVTMLGHPDHLYPFVRMTP